MTVLARRAGGTYPPGMVLRIWGRAVLTAVGAGVLVAAGQLGVGYGLGIVRLGHSFEADTGNQWHSQLAWVSWFAMLAAVAGAATAQRDLRRRSQYPPGVGSRIVLALFGGIGAAAVIPLTLQPARATHLVQPIDPTLVIGLAAALGAVAGVLIAVATLSLRPLAWNLAVVAAVAWLFGLVAVVPYLGPDNPLPAVRLGVPQWTSAAQGAELPTDTLAMPVLAWLAGAVVAAVARRRGEPGLSIAVSGMAGAVPLALAYLIAGPGSNTELNDQMSPYLGALIAIPSGLLGSLLIALVPRRDADRDQSRAGQSRAQEQSAQEQGQDRVQGQGQDEARDQSQDTTKVGTRAGSGSGEAVEPTNIIPPLTPPSQADPMQSPIPQQRRSPVSDASSAFGRTSNATNPNVSSPNPDKTSTSKKPSNAKKPPNAKKASARSRDEHIDWVSTLGGRNT